ncbi:MAG: hypothetical protein JOZ41_11360 [Chloroflexi bacterium]|nr:hypothetical protein [Chloroflexota bacterium]
MDTEMFDQCAGTWHQEKRDEEVRTPNWFLWISTGVGTLLLIGFLAGFVVGHQPVDGLEQQNSALRAQLAETEHQEQVLLAGRHCSTYDRQIQEIQGLISRGNPQVAASLATLYLESAGKPACPQTKVTLGALSYTATLDALFAEPPPSALDHRPLLTWLSAERQADAIGVPLEERLSPFSIVVDAYNDHMWELAKAAFLRAWQRGLVGPGDVTQIASYYAILRNFGDALVREGQRSARHQGLVSLRTSDAISTVYSLGRGEAHADLVRLLGPQTRVWPGADTSDPVLAAGEKRR